MIKTKNLIFSGVIISICVIALLLLLFSSSIPIFTVKELKSHSNPESYLKRKIQVTGVVGTLNGTGFLLREIEDINNTYFTIYIEAISVEKPNGFEVGKHILVEGKLISLLDIWVFKANMISTKCSTKYTDGN